MRVGVIGAGIGGLTAAALLAKRGFEVVVWEQAAQVGGCASTFRRGPFVFDVGATQVAGLEPGGIHHQIFTELEVEMPTGEWCDPACAVYLPGETTPIQVWRDPQRWQAERQRHFPGSEQFWQFMDWLFAVAWRFQQRQPVMPPRVLWDWLRLLGALNGETLLIAPLSLLTVGQVLRLFGLGNHHRLKTFLDMQLKLYSQCDADETALLYGATALGIPHAPHGLWHLHGSMQVLSQRLLQGLQRWGGRVKRRHRVTEIVVQGDRVQGVWLENARGQRQYEPVDHLVANVTAMDLVRLLGQAAPRLYRWRVEHLPPASGAFVVYLGVKQAAIPSHCPLHLQFLYDAQGPIGENNSLFVSVSQPGDGRAPAGMATIVASSFTDVGLWQQGDYQALKAYYTEQALARLGTFFDLSPEHLIHVEAATPRTFARYTARHLGMVGGVGQRVSTFGLLALATRTPIAHLWLVGDSVHPGEGTAGVSYSAVQVVNQIGATVAQWKTATAWS
ncbi:MAG: C-3',4' desaturase CrtD [Gloeomargarita sp. SKYBB_i_bin120]|nr:C-3',4' desaturase CrtD [Gloeomargarita sp. SKYG98]MCS7292824.1 C-3',4' desaturase CrtD [Gloeomargarita sp. SKYB120]MDW8178387.1 C-3',4' desaturase CrtD [Gloeomargarita sp. SKYBB_i_bin120]